MDYIEDTKNAYKGAIKAKEYQEQYTRGFKWARFTMRRQRKIIDRIIHQCNFTKTDKILDIPCGDGSINYFSDIVRLFITIFVFSYYFNFAYNVIYHSLYSN